MKKNIYKNLLYYKFRNSIELIWHVIRHDYQNECHRVIWPSSLLRIVSVQELGKTKLAKVKLN